MPKLLRHERAYVDTIKIVDDGEQTTLKTLPSPYNKPLNEIGDICT